MLFDFFNRNNSNSKSRQSGFTLIEVLVALAIMGILAAIAMPSFTSTIRRYTADAIRDDLTASLQLAKSEAIHRGQIAQVTITRIPRSATCMTDTTVLGVWTCGWQIYMDANNNGIFDDGAANLIQQSTVPAGFSVLETTIPLALDSIVATRWGQFTSTPRLVIAPIIAGNVTPSDPAANALCLGVGGKLVKVKHTSGAVTCP